MTMCKLVLVAGLLGFATGCEEEEDYVIWECEVECDYEDDYDYYYIIVEFEGCDINDEDAFEDEANEEIEDLEDDLEDDGYYNVSCDWSCETDGESCEPE